MTGEASPATGEAAGAASPVARGGVLRLPAFALDAAVGAVMLGIALWFWLEAAAIESRSRGLMSPLAFPKGISAMLALCAVLMIGRSLVPAARAGSATVAVERPWFVLAAMGMAILYPLLLGWLGYYLATGLWLPPFLWIAGYRRPVGLAVATLGFLVFTRVIFQQVLGTPMP